MTFDINQNPYSFFESQSTCNGSFNSDWTSWASKCIGDQFPKFDEKQSVSVCVKNRFGVVLEKNYSSLKEFQAESLKYRTLEPISTTQMTFTVNRVNSITNFATDLLFPHTARLHRSYYAGQILWMSRGDKFLDIFGSFLIDVVTIFARVVTLPYRLATVDLKSSHPLFKELTDTDDLYVFITAQVNTGLTKRVLKLAYPLFLSNMNEYIDSIPHDRKVYYSCTTTCGNRSSSKPSSSKPNHSSSKPNDRRSESNSSKPKVSETPIDTAFKFFGMNANSPWKAIKKKYTTLALACHPDKLPDNPEEAQARFTTLSNHFALLKKHYKQP